MGKDYTMIGYHGTTLSAAETILKTKVFHDSTKDREWLGKGVYFFAYKQDAITWAIAQTERPENGGELPAVLSSRLVFCPEQLLDLDDPAALENMHTFLKKVGYIVQKHISADCAELTGHALWKQWCFNCELYKKLNPKIGIIVYTFHFTNDYAKEFFYRNQRQICVSDHSIITNIAREGIS